MLRSSEMVFLRTVMPDIGLPFDVLGGVCDEESLRVGVEFELGTWVDGDIAFRAVLVAGLNRYQQQTQLYETKPTHVV